MIHATNLGKRFGAHDVLRCIQLRVEPGERVAMLGLNGAGKTTLIRCLLGLVPFEGDLRIGGCDVHASGRAARSRIGYVPQRAPHFDGSLGEIIDFIARLRDIDGKRVEERLSALGLSLTDHGDKPVPTLSGGMLQKVLLALALAAEVPLLLLDEPTANLDPRARRDFLRTLQQVNADTTIFLASHRLTDVEAVADRLLVLHEGQIVFDGAMDTVWQLAGAVDTLWIKVPAERRAEADSYLRSTLSATTVLSNGAALGLRVPHAVRSETLFAVERAGIPIEDFWTEAASLNDVLEGILAHQPLGAPEHRP